MIRGIRGATTIHVDNESQIIDSTEKLIQTMIAKNDIEAANVASVFISATSDIQTGFPAKALRRFPGWTYVPVMCMQEMDVEESLAKCVRVMIHYNTNKSQEKIHHVYLEDAIKLRPDLVKHSS
ncbi:chorismate mutase [Rossellomorea sp. BNER]|jgi:chorismate mutase|uniref:chorismate mutase n=1 Tax=Rossellomorea sp. BNER TaxID=2962031 RepID=UPI003AF1F02D|nr:chorismate mutase [Rossellomorea sp. BNER]